MTTSTETIRVNQPRELLALIPYQLGFTPTDSLVVVSLRGPRGRVGLVVRIDLADTAQGAAALAHHLHADSANSAVVVTYTDNLTAARTATDLVTSALRAAHIDEGGAWTVTATGYRALDCEDLTCCPEAGRPLSDLNGTEVAAALTYAGISPVPTRANLAVTRITGKARLDANRAGAAWLRTHTAKEDATRTAGLTAWQDATTTPLVPAARLGIIAAALTDVVVRDAILISLIPGTPADLPTKTLTGKGSVGISRALGAILDSTTGVRPGAEAERAVDLLTDAAAHATASRAAAPLTLLALLAWWSGDGARAAVLLEQALTHDPAHRLAILLHEVSATGMSPGWVRRTA
jgi:hypothetical protein